MASVFRVTRNGKKLPAWRYKYKDSGGRWKYGVGWPDRKRTLEHALAVEAEHRAIRNGQKEAPPAWLKLRNTPVRQVVEEYLASGKTSGGRRGYGWSARHLHDRRLGLDYWVRELNLETIGDITLAGAHAKIRGLLQKGRSGKTASNRVEALKAFCCWAVKHGFLKSNPLADMPKFNTRPGKPHRALSDDEIRRLLVAAPPERQMLYRLALATGFRAGEIRSLRVKDLDVFGSALRLTGMFTKNRQDAVQPMGRTLARELRGKSTDTPDAPLIHVPGPFTVSENFRRDCDKAGITRLTPAGKATFHSFRVNYISAVVESGTDLKTIMTLARHGSAQMSMEVYAKPKPQLLRAAAEAASKRIEDAQKGSPCCTGVAQAIAGGGGPVSTDETAGVSEEDKLATPRMIAQSTSKWKSRFPEERNTPSRAA